MKVFACIRRTPAHEHLLHCSCLEIYNEMIYDLLVPSSAPAIQLQGSGANVWLTPLGGCDKPRARACSDCAWIGGAAHGEHRLERPEQS
jgi:hypothetical protein